ncbi:Hypothetical protein NGAL_HAMBI490_54900 [Neorhizobium galegae bv. officinalis]|nr:Hypothetical protein NGAL_HAMBI490_54900 [Neorhizobium galegae bv. officinalis]
MKTTMKQTLAIALLAGSTLSVVPAIAQTQAPATGQDSGSPTLPRKLPPGSDGSSGAKQTQPQQDMGATTQQPQGGASGSSSTTAQSTADDPQRLKKGDTAAQEKPADAKKAQSADAQTGTKDNTAQQKPAGQNGSSTAATSGSGSGSGTDASKSATEDTARPNNGAQQPDSNQAATGKPSNETTGSINISTEQRTQVRQILVQNKVEPVDVDIRVDVGVAVPTTVELHPLPPRIVEIVPAYRGYEYFLLADGRIIIVEPSSHKIVYILVG